MAVRGPWVTVGALLLAGCTGTPGAAEVREPGPGTRPSVAPAAPGPAADAVVFAPVTPPALLPARPAAPFLPAAPATVGAPGSDFDSLLPPIPIPAGRTAPLDFAGEDPVFAAEPAEAVPPTEEDPWYGDGGEPVEVVRVHYYEVHETPAREVIEIGTPVLVVEGYRSWAWGGFTTVASAPAYDPCAAPDRGAWWVGSYDPSWDARYDPSWSARVDGHRPWRPGLVYLDLDDTLHRHHHGCGCTPAVVPPVTPVVRHEAPRRDGDDHRTPVVRREAPRPSPRPHREEPRRAPGPRIEPAPGTVPAATIRRSSREVLTEGSGGAVVVPFPPAPAERTADRRRQEAEREVRRAPDHRTPPVVERAAAIRTADPAVFGAPPRAPEPRAPEPRAEDPRDGGRRERVREREAPGREVHRAEPHRRQREEPAAAPAPDPAPEPRGRGGRRGGGDDDDAPRGRRGR